MTIDKWIKTYEQQCTIFHEMYEGICEEVPLMDIYDELQDDPFTNQQELRKAMELIDKVMVFAEVDRLKAIEQIYNYLNNKFYQIIV